MQEPVMECMQMHLIRDIELFLELIGATIEIQKKKKNQEPARGNCWLNSSSNSKKNTKTKKKRRMREKKKKKEI